MKDRSGFVFGGERSGRGRWARAVALMGVLALVVGAGGGCSSYSAPTLRVSGVKVKERTEAGVVLDFALEATNRNEIELPLREVRYSVTLDGKPVFSGVRSPEASLRRLGVQTIHVPAVVAAGDVPAGGARYVMDGTLGYITPGKLAQVLFDIKVRRPSVGFREEGEVEIGAKQQSSKSTKQQSGEERGGGEVARGR